MAPCAPWGKTIIRASVDAVCRDGTSETYKTPSNSAITPSYIGLENAQQQLLDSSLAIHKPSLFLPASSLARDNPLHALVKARSRYLCHHNTIFVSS